ncbi:MAG: sensor histidine kinase, partial [Rhizobacter sp.]|nr:sensor histidine kinase [Rhizobacter sp.]
SIYSLLEPDSHLSVRVRVAEAQRNDAPPTRTNGRIARLDGTVREVELAVAGLPDHGQAAVQMVIRDVTEDLRESQALARSRGELRRLSARLTDAREEERRRIARELHDELGQRLTALKMELSGLQQRLPDATQHARMATMLEMVDDTVASVRRIATDLRPLMLDDLGLNAAIEWLAHGWARRMGIAVKLRLGAQDPPVNEATAIALYRMAQEALTNVARHAGATEARIELQQLADKVLLVVQDNGVGFSDPGHYREDSHGVLGMRERAYMLGGRLETGNAPGGGARVVVHLPIVSATAQAPADTAAAAPAQAPAGKP